MYLLAHLGITLAGGLLARRAWAFPLGWLLAGAVLPDLVDKPLGLLLGLGYGRLLMHTLLALALVAGLAAWRRSARLGALAAGIAGHLALDRLWEVPSVLLWPLLGPFPREDWTIARYVEHAHASAYVAGLEVIGGAALALAALWWWRKGASARAQA